VTQLLSRKTIAKAEELKSKIGPRQIGVSGNVNAGQRTQPLSGGRCVTDVIKDYSYVYRFRHDKRRSSW